MQNQVPNNEINNQVPEGIENKSAIAITPINSEDYEISESLWSSFQTEVNAVLEKIDSGAELQPKDVASVKALHKEITSHMVEYTKQINLSANEYKQKAKQELSSIGYDKIEHYILMKKKEQSDAVSSRIFHKVEMFNRIVKSELENHPVIQNSAINTILSNNLIKRFPKVNSGDKTKNIENWEPIQTIISLTMNNVSNILTTYPIVQRLPLNSHSMRNLSLYISSGDMSYISEFENIIKNDAPLLENMKIKDSLTTIDDVLDQIQLVLVEDIPQISKLQKISKLITLSNHI